MRIVALALLGTSLLFAETPPAAALKQEAAERVQAQAKRVQQIVDMLFSLSELGYQEHETAKYLTGMLRDEGFEIAMGVAGMPSAWVAEWGRGKPIVGLMADVDGLPETSQKPGVARREPLIPGGPGHGEGHNAGQAVQVAAALATKQILERYGMPGTIRIYPGIAEELLGSRTYMARDGLFRDLDAMLSCHVSSRFLTSWGNREMALVSTEYTFHGVSAHGAGSPWKGRSALDAVELMNAGWNFRREHLRPQQRSHYVITHGGNQPNVVPSEASVWYFFRELDYENVKRNHDIGTRIAQAAAQMTDTTMTERLIGSTWPGHFNKPLAELLHKNMAAVGMPEWSEDDQRMAKAIQKLMEAEPIGLRSEIEPLLGPTLDVAGSDDIAEVSWNVPTINMRYPANVAGAVGHHWSSAIAMATPIAHKGALTGAKVQAMTLIELFRDPTHIEQAWDYFREQTKEIQWKPLIPKGTAPPAHLNRDKMERFAPELEKLRYDPSRFSTYLEQLGVEYPTLED